ncbi:glutamic acid-rich protein isoform X3 [Brassica rapa]|uniref:glutamic acid-rich protein isoform X3 n=1 Tax=Brassica campestris TaxID=3711 RepID=UPI00142E5FAB|nr:glutamic acid-rich protein isoform X3 [Brassica rapa]
MSGESAVTAMETTERATANQSSFKNNSNNGDTTDMELQILAAMRSRVTYLRNKADSVTFASVRRLLEEDMGLEKYALDAHKSFVKDNLVKCLEDPGDADGASENPQETEKKDDLTPVKEEAVVREETVGDEGNREALMSDIKRALHKRASYIKANSEEITMASLRRLLEEDLKLKKDSLVPFKKFINKELDAVLQIPDPPKKKVKSTASKKVGSEDDSDSDSGEVAVKKTLTQKRKRKIDSGKPVAGKKKAKHTEADSENDSDAGDSEMKAEKPLKQQGKETAITVYGKRVDHLKSVIKSCGMSIPPVIYRKVKQAPEEKREATLIEELEQILAKEGLSSDPSEKEIKEVKKKKERSKELEGIDTSNIVSSSRRRSATSFAPPPKPKITSESESDEEESENGEDNEEEEEEGNEETGEGSQSEEESNNDDDGGEESE